ncbi:DUF3177 family protein [Synechococcales cyanobacterium C]|uniref:DUF3177 family protein n=1 Tax=Petrachloros mirabilis ULC683 TaxID=2781853 RepID=A0A8K2A0T2_9CYAN|nr:DUF3177 family protein [Petrachloros mirabilis]NCJ07508.1 DUF3177 family protein [Petrachloros mirabilis ULC683]
MALELLQSLVWTEYRLAILFTVIIPLGLLAWAVLQKAHAITHLLTIYWRVASLLAITVYLMVAQIPLSFGVGFLALLLIPISLWFWVDLNEEIDDRRGYLKLALTAWRWATTLFCLLAAALQVPYLRCALSTAEMATPTCQAWLEPTYLFWETFHSGARVGRMSFLALLALVIYGLYLLYFLIFRLSKQGRSATGF